MFFLKRFYSSRKRRNESVSEWACQLKDLIGKIQANEPTMSMDTCRGMSKSKFRSGLSRETIKNSYKYDSVAGYEDS